MSKFWDDEYVCWPAIILGIGFLIIFFTVMYIKIKWGMPE